ncbi:MAG: hypothetical protein JU82_02360 [Sulfuricurvum sp. MLSB]|uniref:acyltransferase family protein n=1 Tax=unclassified Sulfuricurvum TaxID=2632390 RepID=UPI000504DA15|nr:MULTISPECIES: acyltransferase [unclassified Sulfuricurvum]KFN40556.1 MAG: hypothetical protein JU82_02360 [Sulfuricurvum sp. MLSB]
MGRVYTIDYLRGILALLVMVYHYSMWEKLLTPDATSFLTRNALYGVSLFFIISGFSLTLSYYRKFDHFDIRALKDYFFKRFARIYPLYWLVVTLFLASLLVGGKTFPAIEQILLNLTISFVFFGEYTGFTAGSWSIGMEIAFYLLLPIALYVAKKGKTAGTVLLFALALSALAISSYGMYDSPETALYWPIYMNPLNHVYFFLFGILAGVFYLEKNPFFILRKRTVWLLIAVTAAIAVFYPIKGGIVALIYEENRLILSAVALTLFYLFTALNPHINPAGTAEKVFERFGNISYTVYLLHPVIFLICNVLWFNGTDITPEAQIVFMILVTLIASHIVYARYELPMTRYLLSRRPRHD